MYRAVVRDFQHSSPLLGGQLAGNVDIATHPIHAMVLLVTHLDIERAQGDALVPGVERQSQRGTRGERSIEQLVRAGPEILATDVSSGVGEHDVRPDLDLLGKWPDGRFGHSNDTFHDQILSRYPSRCC